MSVTKAEWITEEALFFDDKGDHELQRRPRKRLKAIGLSKTRKQYHQGNNRPLQPSHHIFPRSPNGLYDLLVQRDYCTALPSSLPLPNRLGIHRKMITSLSCAYTITNMRYQSEHSEVFGKDYPLEYSPDGRLLLGLNFPLRTNQADLLLMDTNARTVHNSTSTNGHRNYMFTWTSPQSFVTGSLSPDNDEALRLWDVRNLSTHVFSQPTESSLGFELMDDPLSQSQWLIGVHTEKIFGRPQKSQFCEWSSIHIKQANTEGFKQGNLDIKSQGFDVFGVPHTMSKNIQQYGLPYIDGGLVRCEDERVVIVAESFNLMPSSENLNCWPRFQALRSQPDPKDVQDNNTFACTIPFRHTPQTVQLSATDPSLYWMEGLHPDPSNDGFVVVTKHASRSEKWPRLTKLTRTTTKDFISYYAVRKKTDGMLELHKTATMGVAEGDLCAHPEWKKPSYFKFAPNGAFVGQLVDDKLRVITNGSFVRPFVEENKVAVSDLVISNEIAFPGKDLRNFAVSPLDNLTCAVSARDGRIFVTQPVW